MLARCGWRHALQASCVFQCFRMGRTRCGLPGRVLTSNKHCRTGEFFGGLKVDDKRIALVFEKTNVNKVREIYSGFLSSSPDALALARRFEHRVREKYDVYLSDDLTAELFAREGIDLPGAIKSIREGGIGNERIR